MGKERTENIGFNDKKGVDNEWCFPFKTEEILIGRMYQGRMKVGN